MSIKSLESLALRAAIAISPIAAGCSSEIAPEGYQVAFADVDSFAADISRRAYEVSADSYSDVDAVEDVGSSDSSDVDVYEPVVCETFEHVSAKSACDFDVLKSDIDAVKDFEYLLTLMESQLSTTFSGVAPIITPTDGELGKKIVFENGDDKVEIHTTISADGKTFNFVDLYYGGKWDKISWSMKSEKVHSLSVEREDSCPKVVGHMIKELASGKIESSQWLAYPSAFCEAGMVSSVCADTGSKKQSQCVDTGFVNGKIPFVSTVQEHQDVSALGNVNIALKKYVVMMKKFGLEVYP
jgi:hypothetical protein